MPDTIFWYLAETTAMSVAAATVVSGALAGAAAGAAAGILSGGGLKGALKGALLGAFTGAAFSRIGVSSMSNAAKVASHGLVGGLRSAANGGKFENGFLSAAFGKMVTFASRAGRVIEAKTTEARFMMATIAGGIGSSIGGGKFQNGAVTAAMGFLFNEIHTYRAERTRPGKNLGQPGLQITKEGSIESATDNLLPAANGMLSNFIKGAKVLSISPINDIESRQLEYKLITPHETIGRQESIFFDDNNVLGTAHSIGRVGDEYIIPNRITYVETHHVDIQYRVRSSFMIPTPWYPSLESMANQ